MRRVPLLICALAVVSAYAAPTGAYASGRAYSPAEVQRLEDAGVREIIVARDPGLSTAQRGDLRTGAGVAHVANLTLPDTEVVRAPAGGLVESLDALEGEPGVRYAEPNGIVRAAAAPNDDRFSLLWGLENTGQPILGVAGTPGADIKALQAWGVSTGTGEVVAVVDSGVATHEDLDGAVWTNPLEVVNGIDDDHDGAIDDVHGWNALTSSTDFTDANGHGTHVTGTIAARANNTVGIAGVAPGAQVFPIAALDSAGNGTDASVARAFDVAGRRGIPIVNASVEAPFSATVQAAVDRHPGTLYVLAAGNEGVDDDDPAPANSNLCQMPSPNVICVGASNSTDGPATFKDGATVVGATNFGAKNVDLFAPGDDIASTYVPSPATCPAPCYAFLDGTSMAAPHVSGTLALMRAVNRSLTAAQLKETLLANVDTEPALNGKAATNGRLNAANAVAAVPAPTQTPPPTTTAAAPATTAATGAGATPVPPASAVAAAVAHAPVLGRPAITAGALTARHALTLRFTLSRAATVKLTITRGTRTVATVSIHGRKGQNRYVLRTKVGGKRLARGRYRVRVRATGAAKTYTLAVTVR